MITLFYLFKCVLAILGHLAFHIKFGICFSKFIHSLVGNLGIALDLSIYLETNYIFTMSSFTACEYGIFLYLVMYSLLFVYLYSFLHTDCGAFSAYRLYILKIPAKYLASYIIFYSMTLLLTHKQ